MTYIIKGPNENIDSTFEQYKLTGRRVDILVADNAKPIWRATQLFDAIVTDRKQL